MPYVKNALYICTSITTILDPRALAFNDVTLWSRMGIKTFCFQRLCASKIALMKKHIMKPFESKAFPPNLYDLHVCDTRRGIKPCMSLLSLLYFSSAVTFEEPFHLIPDIVHQPESNQVLPVQYSADVQATSSHYRRIVTGSRGHHLSQCSLLKLFLRKKGTY